METPGHFEQNGLLSRLIINFPSLQPPEDHLGSVGPKFVFSLTLTNQLRNNLNRKMSYSLLMSMLSSQPSYRLSLHYDTLVVKHFAFFPAMSEMCRFCV